LNTNLRIVISTSTFTRCSLNIVSAAVGVMKLLQRVSKRLPRCLGERMQKGPKQTPGLVACRTIDN
jgi:hypothetical protein